MSNKFDRGSRYRAALSKSAKEQTQIFKEAIPKNLRQQFRTDVVGRKESPARLFTGIVDIDLNGCLVVGKRVQLIGQPNVGKSLLCYILGGAAQLTCRLCYTPIMTWYDDWPVYQQDPKDWEKRHAAMDFPSTTTCLCGACDPMRVLVVDPETSFDPSWAGIWGLMTDNIDRLTFDEALEFGSDEDNDGGDDATDDSLTTQNQVLYLLQPDSGADVEAVLLPLIEHGAIDFIIIDALPSVATAEDLKGDERLGSHARFNSRVMTLLMAKMTSAYTKFRSKVMLVAVNHFMQGPTRNTKEDPNKPAGGKKLGYLIDVDIRIRSSRSNVTIDQGYKQATVMRDVAFDVAKTKVGDPGGRSGTYRLFLDDYDSGKAIYKAGSSNDADRLFAYLKDINDPRVFEKVMSGKSIKGYKLLGREFKRVADMVAFLGRRDIQFLCRPLLLAAHAPASARMSFDIDGYLYNPFPDPISELIHELRSTTGDALYDSRVADERRALRAACIKHRTAKAPDVRPTKKGASEKPKRGSRGKK